MRKNPRNRLTKKMLISWREVYYFVFRFHLKKTRGIPKETRKRGSAPGFSRITATQVLGHAPGRGGEARKNDGLGQHFGCEGVIDLKLGLIKWVSTSKRRQGFKL